MRNNTTEIRHHRSPTLRHWNNNTSKLRLAHVPQKLQLQLQLQRDLRSTYVPQNLQLQLQ
jgi:hypothetical protein